MFCCFCCSFACELYWALRRSSFWLPVRQRVESTSPFCSTTCRCQGTFPATWLTTSTSSPTDKHNTSKIQSEQMQKHCSHCTIWGNGEILHAGKWKWIKVSFKFKFKCRCWWRHFWRKTVPGFCRRNTKHSVADSLKTCLCGTARSADDAERKRRPGKSATCCRLSVTRICWCETFRHRNASTAS